jgi:hypothetical protein
MQVCEQGESHKHQLVVKPVQPLQLVQVVVSGQTQLLVRTQLVQVVALLVRTQLVLAVVLLEQKQLRTHRLIQDVRPLQQLYQLRHQLQEVFPQLVKEFQYQPCQ